MRTTMPLAEPNWPYAKLAAPWGGEGIRVASVTDLCAALLTAAACDSFVIIELMLDTHDFSPVSRKYIAASARKGRGASK